ncbi:MAG: leucine-rich repeat protein [Ruminococcus sp.]|nr:leucine-rich repeat protein [Ruminococcus sp.]
MKKVISLFLSILMLFSTMTGLTFTAQAKEKITKIEVDSVPEPFIGATIKDLCSFSVPEGAEYCGYSSDFTKCMLWFDLDSDTPNTPLPTDTVCVEGHSYRVSVRLIAVGNTFASSPKVYINGNEGWTSTYLGRNPSTSLAVEYQFPKLKKKPIDNINAFFEFNEFTKGITVNSYSTLVYGNKVNTVTTGWFHDGKAVQGDTTVTYGNWGFLIGLTASGDFYFDKSSTITIEDKLLTTTDIYLNGKVAFFRSADDFFTVSCTHNYSSSWSCDGTTHWKECSICNEKGELNAHTFGAGVTEGEVTTYTCSECGYKKVDKYIENGFRYADVDGGVQVVTYQGNDVNVNVPDVLGGKKVVSIADYAFATAKNKTSIKSITLPSTVTSIGKNAFNGCTALTSVNIPSGVTRIENETFLGCESLGNIAIPYGVTFIGTSAFQGCGISSIVIPCSVNTIKSQAFRGCDNLGSVVVPDSVTTLETGAFISCKGLKTVVIGDRVTKIPDSVFDSSNALESLTLPAGLTSIGKYNLDNKSNFTKIYFRGTQTQWNAVKIGTYNTNSATVEYNYTKKTDVGQHKYQKLTAVEPNCVNEGFVLNICEGCTDSFKTNVTPATGIHTYNSGAITKETTCTEDGEKVYSCNICGASHTETIPSTGHQIGTITTKATTSRDGKIVEECSVCKEIISETIISKVSSVKLSATSYTYNGKVRTPSVTVKDSKGNSLVKNTDYTVSYASGRKNVGKYAVKITFKGNYSGTKTLYFTIKPKATTISKVTSGSKKFTVKWKKQATQTTGYQIQYSTSSKFSKAKTVTVSKNSTTSKTISKLKAKKKYYVRVRTYKTVKFNGKATNIYSSWSKEKYVTTKK